MEINSESQGTQSRFGDSDLGAAESLGASPDSPKSEGPVAREIEEVTSELPSETFLLAAGGAIVASLALQVLGKQKTGNFVAQWVPTILIMGVYNKLVKLHGHDRAS